MADKTAGRQLLSSAIHAGYNGTGARAIVTAHRREEAKLERELVTNCEVCECNADLTGDQKSTRLRPTLKTVRLLL